MQPILQFGRHILSQVETAVTKEWFLTSGTGTYASGTVVGTNTRKDHALLVSGGTGSVLRSILVNRLEESVIVHDRRINLSCQEYPGTLHPQGFLHLETFIWDPVPSWVWSVSDSKIKKSIFLLSGEEATVLLYENLLGPTIKLQLRPFLSCRYNHELTREDARFENAITFLENGFTARVAPHPEFYLLAEGVTPLSALTVDPQSYWYKNLFYAQEEERGLADQEDLFSPCQISAELKEGETLAIVLTTRPDLKIKTADWMREEIFFKDEFLKNLPVRTLFMEKLALAADQFWISNGDRSSLVSDYPWNRQDTRKVLLALPGLALINNRQEEAKAVLEQFSKDAEKGWLAKETHLADLPTLDNALWWVWAVQKIFGQTTDLDFLKRVFPRMQQLIQNLTAGISINAPRFSVQMGMSEDGLLFGQSDILPLTWMNADLLGRPATPRWGKPIEVQALWYNALEFFAESALKLGKSDAGAQALAKKVKTSFQREFINVHSGYLRDVVDGARHESSVRPNALWTISLPYEILEMQHAKKVFELAWEHLYTSFGLRTLSYWEPHFHGIYKGDEAMRAQAAHNGSVHAFLLGTFMECYFKIYGNNQRTKEAARNFLIPIASHFSDAGLGTISEIFDGNVPHFPRGAFADSTAVGEISRVILEAGIVL